MPGATEAHRSSTGRSDRALWLVSAAWVRGEEVAAHGVRPGARASANRANRAASALSFQPGTIA